MCRCRIEFHFICRNGIAQEVSAVPSSSSGETISLSCTIYKGSIGGDLCCAMYTVHRASGLHPASLLAGAVTDSVQTGQRKERDILPDQKALLSERF
jgi:hypothetical protein